MELTEYREALKSLEEELGVELRLGYTGNLYRDRDDRLWDVCIHTPVPKHETEGRGPWSHRASGQSYPATRSWTTERFPTVEEVVDLVRSRHARESGPFATSA